MFNYLLKQDKLPWHFELQFIFQLHFLKGMFPYSVTSFEPLAASNGRFHDIITEGYSCIKNILFSYELFLTNIKLVPGICLCQMTFFGIFLNYLQSNFKNIFGITFSSVELKFTNFYNISLKQFWPLLCF